jgi:hypothetical protein
MTDSRAAGLGFKSHIGWSFVVAVAGSPAGLEVVAKRRIDLATTFDEGAVYHVSQGLPVGEAEGLIRSRREAFERAAAAGVASILAELRAAGIVPVASAVVSGGARPLPPLEKILRSHALVHAAEGELYRSILARASESCGLPAVLVLAGELAPRAARALRLPEGRVASKLAALGKQSGRPWGQDQKEAALAALVALLGPRHVAHAPRPAAP